MLLWPAAFLADDCQQRQISVIEPEEKPISHVLRGSEESVAKGAQQLEVQGRRCRGIRMQLWMVT